MGSLMRLVIKIMLMWIIMAMVYPCVAQRRNPARRYEDSVAAVVRAEKAAYIKRINSLGSDSLLQQATPLYDSAAGSAKNDQWFISKPKAQRTAKQDAFFYALAILLLALGVIRISFPKYFSDLFRLFFRVTFRQQAVRDQLSQNTFPSLLLNVIFFLSGGMFLSLLSHYYGWIPTQGFWYNLLFWSGILIAIYLFKLIVMQCMSWLFHMRDAGTTYSFIVFLINKITGVALLPFIIFLGLGPEEWKPVMVTMSFILLGGLFLYRYIISYPSVKNTVRLNRFHFIIYLWALEILPLLLIYKGLALQLSRN